MTSLYVQFIVVYTLTLRPVNTTMVEEGTNITVEVVLNGALAPGVTVTATLSIMSGSASGKHTRTV